MAWEFERKVHFVSFVILVPLHGPSLKGGFCPLGGPASPPLCLTSSCCPRNFLDEIILVASLSVSASHWWTDGGHRQEQSGKANRIDIAKRR